MASGRSCAAGVRYGFLGGLLECNVSSFSPQTHDECYQYYARNTTVTCDPDLFRMAGQVDLYYWEQDNLTDLCSPSCLQSSSDWLNNVYNTCDGQTITIDSKMVPVESVAIRYSDGIGLACLTDMYECEPKY